MKFTKIAVAAVFALSFSSAYAFHEGGVAYCEGCHTMHNSRNNTIMNKKAAQFSGVKYLLQGTDASSTCLNCHGAADGSNNDAGVKNHSDYHIMTTGAAGASFLSRNHTPGGDFGWLTQGTRTWTLPRAGSQTAGGHNVVAADFAIPTDSRFPVSPGGAFPTSQFTCASCHDPHGKYRFDGTSYTANPGFTKGGPSLGTALNATAADKPIIASGSYGEVPPAGEAVGSYRLLAGVGYRPASTPTAPAFTNDPPVAVAPSHYNRQENTEDTRVAYGAGMSEWCGNCHASIHNDSATAGSVLIHPAGDGAKLQADTTFKNYNAYVKSGDMTGVVASSYTSLVPYEMGTKDLATLAAVAVNDGSAVGGPTTGTENVSCLSCHRAHASAWESMTRWNNRAEFLTVDGAYPGTNLDPASEGGSGVLSTGMTQTQYQNAMYERPASDFATFQRSLCNKCHAKD